MGGIYNPDTSQLAQQFGVNPFQKFAIDLGNVDRTNGLALPQLEGDFLYVARCDYPALLSLIFPGSDVNLSHYLYPGLEIRGAFKGAYLTHPLLTTGTGQYRLELMTGKGLRTYTDNTLGSPYAAHWPGYAVITNTGVSLVVDIPIPAGTRYLSSLDLLVGAATVTRAQWQLQDKIGASIIGATFPVPYNNTTSAGGEATFTTVANGVSTIQVRDVPLPTNAAVIRITVTGTGLVVGPSQQFKWSLQ